MGWYREALSDVEGISFLEVGQGDRSTYKDFTVLVEPDAFGLDADSLGEALAAVGIETRRYYSPPVHTMRAYRRAGGSNGDLPVTDVAASRTLTLPLWTEMTEAHVGRVAHAIGRIRRYVRNRTS